MKDVMLPLKKQFPEAELLFGLKQGDSKSFELLFEKYYYKLCNYAMVFLKSKDLAEEIVQETFIKFWENRDKIEISSSFRAYIYKSIYNHCLIYLKKQDGLRSKFEKMAEEIVYHYQINHERTNFYLSENKNEKDNELRLNKLMEKLPEQCKDIFYKSRFENLTYQQISESLNLSVNTIKTQIKRALHKLRTYYYEEYLVEE